MSASQVIDAADESAVVRLAEFMALVLRAGDVVALSGQLGAGKTTFARALMRGTAGDDDLEVPSPTFSLVQTYDSGRLVITHFDFYRLRGGDELEEIGFFDASRDGVVLVEWPERAEDALPQDRLEISFGNGATDATRRITLTGHGSWKDRCARLMAMMAFCAQSPWSDARPVFLQGDASTRAYARLHRDGETAILMDSPPRPDGPPVRDGKPYSQLVHLAEDVKPFVAVADALGRAGLTVPEILAHDLEQGFLLTSDLGDRVFSQEAGEDPSPEELYQAATDVLVHLRASPPNEPLSLPDGSTHIVPEFDLAAFLSEAELLLEWFYPALHGAPADAEVRNSFLEQFTVFHAEISDADPAWVLRDYHSPNLMWLPERDGITRVGVIDFQDAMHGHAAYDLVSLLQDARRDILPKLEAQLYEHYCEQRLRADSAFDAQAFAAAYAIHGAQRNSKIIGIFARLSKRDGKHGYLAHIPRVSDCLERNLAHPRLSDLRSWFEEHLPAQERAMAFG